jgi:uncharacterized protein (DUF1778 family)
MAETKQDEKVVITLKLTKEHHEQLEAAATEAGLSLSSFIAVAALEKAKTLEKAKR